MDIEWTLVSQELPEESEEVLLYYERNAWQENGKRVRKKEVGIGWHISGRWHVDGCSHVIGLAWIKIPDPPQLH